MLADLNAREDPDAKAALANQIIKLNSVTPGGLADYCKRARELLEASRNNVNPFDAFKPDIPQGVYLKPGQGTQFDDME